MRTTAREQIVIVTAEVNRALAAMTKGDGLCTVVVPHTTCAISINETASRIGSNLRLAKSSRRRSSNDYHAK